MLAPNTLLRNGRYRIVRPIAQGGQGAVYETWDLRLNARVALKEALVDNPVLNRAFEREAQRLIGLRHAALPRGIECFVENGKQYFVMEYIGGMDLKEQLRQQQRRAFSVPRVLAWADQLLELLTYLHEQTSPLIHRDIKPANLKVTEDGNIILLDFGLAKGGLTQQTKGRSLQGYTRGYAPPEQILGSPTNERSDLYALGATLYTLLTGEVPPDALVRYALVIESKPDELQLANLLNHNIPAPFAELLVHAMELNPTERPASAREMRAILHRFNNSFNNYNKKEFQSQNDFNSLPTKHPLLISLIMISLLLVISGLTMILISNTPADSTPEVNLTTPPATQIVLAADNSPTATILATPTNTQSPTVPAPPTSTPQPLPTVPPPPTSTPQPSPTVPAPPTSTPQPSPTVPPPPPPTTVPAPTQAVAAIPRAAIQSGNWYGTLTIPNFNGCVGFEVVNSSEVRNVMISASRSINSSASIKQINIDSELKENIRCNTNSNGGTCYVTLFCSELQNYLNNNKFESCQIIVGTFTSNTAASGRVDSPSEINGSKISGTWSAKPSTDICK